MLPTAKCSMLIACALALTAALAAAPPARAAVLAEIDHLEPGALQVRGFHLSRAGEVHVEAVGLVRTLRLGDPVSAWILDSDSRQVVWSMKDDRGSRHRDTEEHDLRLPLGAGVYEVYYATYPQRGWGMVQRDGEWWQEMVRDLTGWDDYEELMGSLHLRVTGDGRPASEADLARSRRRLTDAALVSLTGVPEGRLVARGFQLERPAQVELYAVGEVTEDGGFDYGWFEDLDSGRRPWTFGFRNSEPAGGAEKNRLARTTLELPAGRYAAVFGSDDSHSPAGWNAPPPHDPAFWGLTLTLADADRAAASTFAYDPLPTGEPLVAVAPVGSGELRHADFVLTAPAQVRLWGEGEGVDGRMADRGWLTDESSGRKLWEMSYAATEHAGGAQKNRLADLRLQLPAGRYRLSFATDGSHAWDDWNSGKPWRPEGWGVALYPVDPGFDRSLLTRVDAVERGPSLAEIVRVGDDADRRASFELDRPTPVRVEALGEGTDDRMYDYGWIEDASGRIVWEMTYRATDPAGGASKNRSSRARLELGPGSYTVHYRSDGSHSWEDWNADPPAEPDAWGIRVTRAAQAG